MSTPARPMHDAALRLGLACNQHCVHCHLHTTRREPADADPVEPRVQSLLSRGVRHVTLGGGEPTLSPQLVPALRLLQRENVAMTLETNGLVLAAAAARQRLRDLGVARVSVHLPGLTAESYGAVTRDPAGLHTTLRAIAGLVADGFDVGVAMPVLRQNLSEVAALGAFVAAHLPGVRRVTLGTYASQPPNAPMDLHPQPAAWQAAVAAALAAMPAEVTATVQGGLPACLLDAPERHPRLVALGQAPSQLPETCQECLLRDTCPGPPAGLLDAFAHLRLRPVLRRAVRRQVEALHSRSQPEDNWIRRLVVPGADGQPQVRELLLRIVQQCNERCSFCWVDFEALPCPEPLVRQALAEVATQRPAPIVSFTGGEPTLHPQLPTFVRAAQQAGAERIQLQTNATRVDGGLAAALRDHGLTHALVGLHAHTAELYGQVTGTPHLFEAAVAGVRALLGAGVEVYVNHVLNTDNAPHVLDFVRFAEQRLRGPGGERPLLVFAVAADIAGGPLRREVLPRLSDLAGPLRAALDACLEADIPFAGLTHPCGVPPCLLGGDPRYFHDVVRWRFDGTAEVVDGLAGTHDAAAPSTALPGKIAACATCVYDRFCPGLRAEYVAAHGTTELRPVTSLSSEPVPVAVPMPEPVPEPVRVPVPMLAPMPVSVPEPAAAAVVGLGRMGLRQARILADAGARIRAISHRAGDSTLQQALAGMSDTRLEPRLPLPDLRGSALVTLCDDTPAHLAAGLALIQALAQLPVPRPLLLIEKPLAATADEALQLADAARAAGVRLFVHHTQVGDPGVQALVHLTASGRLGPLRHVALRRAEPMQAPAMDRSGCLPTLHDHLVHEGSLLDLWQGVDAEAIANVRATLTTRPGGFEAEITGQFGLLSATMAASLAPDVEFRRELRLVGTGATATLVQARGLRSLDVDGEPLPLASTDGLQAAVRHLWTLARTDVDPAPWLTAALSAEAGVRVLRAVELLLDRLRA